jgi:hypothetical protein
VSRLGQILVRSGVTTENAVARALGVQHFAGGRIGTLLLERGSVTEDELGAALAQQKGCAFVPWQVLSDIPPAVIAALPAKFAVRHSAIPCERGEGWLKVALRDPQDLRILDELFFVTGRKIYPAIAPEVRIYHALEKYYGERRTPRYAILAEKLSRTFVPAARQAPPPPPPNFFPDSPSAAGTPAPAGPGAREVWGEGAEAEASESPIIQTWKIPDRPQIWGALPGSDLRPEPEPPVQESISWEDMAPPPMWVPGPDSEGMPEAKGESADALDLPADPRTGVLESLRAETPTPPEATPQPPPPPEIAAAPPPPEPAAAAAPAAPPEPVTPAALEPPPPPVAAPVAQVPAPTPAPIPMPTAAAAASEEKFAAVAQARDRDAIADAALSELSRRFARTAIFVVRPGGISGWGAAGEGVRVSSVRAISVPWTQPSLFLNVRLSRSFYLGPLPPLPRHGPIAEAFGGWAQECALQPVVLKERPVAFFYVEFPEDRGASPLDLAFLRELAASAASSFAEAIRLKKKAVI